MGDFYDKQGKWLFSDLKDDKKLYVEDEEHGIYMGPYPQPYYSEAGTVERVYASFVGKAKKFASKTGHKNAVKGEGVLSLFQQGSDGKDYCRVKMDAISGPWSNGALPNGEYGINGGVQMKAASAPSGYVRDGVSFFFKLRQYAKSTRTGLEIHPDGNTEGTLGCIGLLGGASELKEFYKTLKSYTEKGEVHLDVNLEGNTNVGLC